MNALMQKEAFSNTEDLLSRDELFSINASLSPSMNAILQTLYQNPNLQHKALATDTHLSITNLSNYILKLENIKPSLLKIAKSGRSKFYSLSNTGEQYVEQMLLQNPPIKVHSLVPLSLDASKTNAAIQLLHNFIQAAGSDWDIILSDILSNSDQDIHQDLDIIFGEFMNHVTWLKTHQRDESLKKIYSALKQNILVKKLDRYLDRTLKNFYILEPLFQLEKNDTENAYFLIDEMFSEFDYTEAHSSSTDVRVLTEYQYYAIFHHLTIMINDFCRHNYDKKSVIDYWKNVYHTLNPILLYIAEKCYSLHRYQHRI